MSAMKNILLVDDDDDLRIGLAEQLRQFPEYLITECDTGKEGLKTALSKSFHLLILDVGLPDMDGRDLCKAFRAAGKTIPVIMLTGLDADDDTIVGLNSGANDYVTKPFRFDVLMARIRAQLRQFEHSEDAVYYVGPYTFTPGSKTLLQENEDKRVRLTEKETSILKYLLRAGGKAVGRKELLGEVWGYNAAVTTHTLETHVYRLRQKMEDTPSEAKILVTEPGGYKLNHTHA